MPEMDRNRPSVIAASTSEGELTLDRDREYLIKHNGLDTSLGAATDPIFFAVDEDVTASGAEDDNKLILAAGEQMPIGPGVSVLHYLMAANSATFSIVPGPRLLGEF